MDRPAAGVLRPRTLGVFMALAELESTSLQKSTFLDRLLSHLPLCLAESSSQAQMTCSLDEPMTISIVFVSTRLWTLLIIWQSIVLFSPESPENLLSYAMQNHLFALFRWRTTQIKALLCTPKIFVVISENHPHMSVKGDGSDSFTFTTPLSTLGGGCVGHFSPMMLKSGISGDPQIGRSRDNSSPGVIAKNRDGMSRMHCRRDRFRVKLWPIRVKLWLPSSVPGQRSSPLWVLHDSWRWEWQTLGFKSRLSCDSSGLKLDAVHTAFALGAHEMLLIPDHIAHRNHCWLLSAETLPSWSHPRHRDEDIWKSSEGKSADLFMHPFGLD